MFYAFEASCIVSFNLAFLKEARSNSWFLCLWGLMYSVIQPCFLKKARSAFTLHTCKSLANKRKPYPQTWHSLNITSLTFTLQACQTLASSSKTYPPELLIRSVSFLWLSLDLLLPCYVFFRFRVGAIEKNRNATKICTRIGLLFAMVFFLLIDIP